MRKTFTALAAAGVICLATVAATTPARAIDPWTAAVFLIGGIYVGSTYGMPYAYNTAYYRAGPYGYGPYGPQPYAYAPPPPPPVAYQGYVDKGPTERCQQATMMVDGATRQVRICY
jgi:hypothetical protein